MKKKANWEQFGLHTDRPYDDGISVGIFKRCEQQLAYDQFIFNKFVIKFEY